MALRCLSLRVCEVTSVGPASAFSPTGSPGGRSTRSSSGRTPGVAARAASSTCLSTGSRSRSSSLSTTGSGNAPSGSARRCTAPVCSASSMRAAGCCAGSSAASRGTTAMPASASTGSFGWTTFRSGRRTVSALNASTTCSRAGEAHRPLADLAQPARGRDGGDDARGIAGGSVSSGWLCEADGSSPRHRVERGVRRLQTPCARSRALRTGRLLSVSRSGPRPDDTAPPQCATVERRRSPRRLEFQAVTSGRMKAPAQATTACTPVTFGMNSAMLPAGHNPNHDALMSGGRVELTTAQRRGSQRR